MSNKLVNKDLISYSMLALPLAFAGIPIYIHAPDFYAINYNVKLSSLGLILLFLRFIDAIQDPFIGILSDKNSVKRPIIIIFSAFLLAISFTFLFLPLLNNYLIWFGIFTFITTTSFSILTININTIGGLWSKDKNQKTTITSYREAFGLIGLIMAVILPSILQNYMNSEKSFYILSLILFSLFCISSIFYWIWQKKYQYINKIYSNEKLSFKEYINIMVISKKFFYIYGLSFLASSIPAVLVLFFIRDRLNLENYTGLFLLLYFLSGAFGIPFWKYLSCHLNKNRTWLNSMILSIISFIWAYFLTAGDFWEYLIICVLSGVAFGAELVLPPSILADYIQNNHKENQASLHFGILGFLAKLSLALAVALSFFFLDIIDFIPGTNNNIKALYGLSILYAVIPCLIKLISIYLLFTSEFRK